MLRGHTIALILHVASSFVVPDNYTIHIHRSSLIRRYLYSISKEDDELQQQQHHTWSPQDLTKDSVGYVPIPDDDYVKQYQKYPELWPVEFFVIVYRRIENTKTKKLETQILVRKSANGTSKWGLGTGVPATRWMLSTTTATPPLGYEWLTPKITFDARNFPEFPKNSQQSWAYGKIDIRKDAFNNPDATEFQDQELEEYASKIRDELKTMLSKKIIEEGENLSTWDYSTISVVKNIVDKDNSLAAIQGTLRMSGVFAHKEQNEADGVVTTQRYVSLGKSAPDPTKLVQSVRIFTMFPQMPDPMPLPSTSSEELQEEIQSRPSRMVESGRNPHMDMHGRKYTHISTSNVSNTIHGVYFSLDITDLPGLDDYEVPALDLFGTKRIKREWVSLQDLKVLDIDGKSLSTEDTKPTFISGFIVRQLVKEGIIGIGGIE